MLAIEKIWVNNLKLPKEDQWESKKQIIENYCPNSMEIGLDLKEPKHCLEEYNKELCIKCWNREVEEKIEEVNIQQPTVGNFKIKALKSDYKWLTKDKIYEFINGRIIYDEGQTGDNYLDFDDYTNRNISFEVEEIISTESKFEQLKQSPIDFIRLDYDYESENIISLKDNSEIVWTGSESQITYDKIPELVAWLQSVYNYCTELKSNMIEYVDFETAKKWMYDNNGVAECEGVLYDNSGMFSLEVTDSDKWILIKNEQKEGE